MYGRPVRASSLRCIQSCHSLHDIPLIIHSSFIHIDSLTPAGLKPRSESSEIGGEVPFTFPLLEKSVVRGVVGVLAA